MQTRRVCGRRYLGRTSLGENRDPKPGIRKRAPPPPARADPKHASPFRSAIWVWHGSESDRMRRLPVSRLIICQTWANILQQIEDQMYTRRGSAVPELLKERPTPAGSMCSLGPDSFKGPSRIVSSPQSTVLNQRNLTLVCVHELIFLAEGVLHLTQIAMLWSPRLPQFCCHGVQARCNLHSISSTSYPT
jgi:hypothetical protein